MNWKNHLLNYDPNARHQKEITGLVFDIQRFAVHDGGGIRTLVFLKGCPLECLWCQNPESLSRKPRLVYVRNNCIDCGKCLSLCPEGAIKETDTQKRMIDADQCRLCGECIKHCYAGALNIIGRYLTVSQLMEIVERDKDFYENSQGGVTFSGGEPTLQPAFLASACRDAKDRGLHTAIETCAHAGWETFETVLRYTDLVLTDIKHMDPAEHRRLTGMTNEIILENQRKIAESGTSLRFRVPLIPGYNDSEENIRATAAFAAVLPNVQAIDILPYHRLGESKWAQLGRSYELHGIEPPSESHLEALADMVREYDLEVTVGG